MKKLTPIVSALLIAFTSNVAADEFDNMHKQLNIMSDIIKSSVAVQGGRKGSKITGVESTYLKGQGVVFTINSSSRSNQWGNYSFNFVMPDIPPIPPTPTIPPIPQLGSSSSTSSNSSYSYHYSDDHDHDSDVNEEISDAMEQAAESYERAMDVLNNDREKYRNLRDEQRDLSYEVRDLEREKRDLEYQMRRADKESKSEISEQMKKIEAKRADIEQARTKLANKSKELREQQKSQRQEQEKERNNYYQQLTTSLADTFCLYGNGLKSVPKNENVSLIIKSGGDKEGRRYKDKIYVFSKKDISDCAADKINVAKLIEKGQGYQF